MATQHSPMPTFVTQETRTAAESGSGNPPSAAGPRPASASASTTGLRVGPRRTLLPSPPFSPPHEVEEADDYSPQGTSSRRESGYGHMIHVSSSSNDAAKLDVSHLLKRDPSPPPSSSGAEGAQGLHSRSSSVPLPKVAYFSVGPNHRTTVSASSVVLPAYPALSLRQLTHQPSIPEQAPGPKTSSSQRPTLPPLQPPPVLHTTQAPAQGPPAPAHPPHPQQHQPPLAESPYHTQPSPYQQQHLQRGLSATVIPSKRGAGSHPAASPAKRQSKWTPEEDALIIELRGSGMKWEEISKRLPGRSAISCRLHYQNYLERRSEWDEERKNRLARLYERLKPEMWGSLAAELGIPWRAAEAMHWQLGEADMARRAGVVPFSLATSTVNAPSVAAAQAGASPIAQSPYAQIPSTVLGVGPSGLPPPGVTRRSSIVRRPEDVTAYGGPPLPAARSAGGAAAAPGAHGLLPSLAELDRGKGIYDERARATDTSQAYYQPQPPPGHGYSEFRR